MYEIDAVQGYVLGYYNQGEADRRYRILTRNFGVIHAHATSVRKEQSKLKHCLQKLNLVEIETIQSRRGYQITGGRLIEPVAGTLGFRELACLDRVGELIGRLSQNPDAETALFTIVEQAIEQFEMNICDPEIIESWISARVLMEFGYFDPSFCPGIDPDIFQRAQLDERGVECLNTQIKELDRYIKQCLDQTML